MNEFPLTLQEGPDTLLTLDRSRLVIATLENTTPQDLEPMLAPFDLGLEPTAHADARMEGPRVFWVRAIDGSPIDQTTFESLVANFSPMLHWVGAVYRLPGMAGLSGLVCPLPYIVIVKPAEGLSEAGQAQLTAILEGFDCTELAEISAQLPGYRYFRRRPENARPVYNIKQSLGEQAAGLIELVKLEYLHVAHQLTGPTNYSPDNLNPLDQSSLAFSSILEGQQLLDPNDHTPIVVAVIDSGVDLAHPDLELHSTGINIDPPSALATIPPAMDGGPTTMLWEISSTLGHPADFAVPTFNRHGTAVAGIVGMKPDNTLGGWGVLPDARILPIAFTPGHASTDSIARGVNHAVANGARIINMSFGIDLHIYPNTIIRPLEEALENAHRAGLVLCAAAGNFILFNPDHTPHVKFPGVHRRVMACAAFDQTTHSRWIGSCMGSEVSVAAPSRRLSTTDIQGRGDDGTPDYRKFSVGMTSFATPILSGIAGMLMRRYPHLTNEQIRTIIERTALKVGAIPYSDEFPNGLHNGALGFGVANAYRALDFADVHIRHYEGDEGLEPTPTFHDVLDACDTVVSTVDFPNPENAFGFTPNSFSGAVVPQVDNYVYVRVRNTGPAAARNVVASVRLVPQKRMPFSLADYRAIDFEHIPLLSNSAHLATLPAGSSAVFKFELSLATANVLLAAKFIGTNYSLLAEVNADNDYAHFSASFDGTSLERRRNNMARRDLTVEPLFLETEPQPDETGDQNAPVAITQLHAFRATDMLDLQIELRNLKPEPADKPERFVRANRLKPAHVIVHFAPQSIAEEAFFEGPGPAAAFVPTGQPQPMPPPGPALSPQLPVRRRIADKSRLAFRLPEALDALPYTLDALLDWLKLEPSIASRAASLEAARESRPTDPIAAPAETETALEVPHRLVLSPNERSTWVHSSGPVTHDSRTELWHTRLAVRVNGEVREDEPKDRTVRAIWSPDYRAGVAPVANDYPFRTTLTANDRHQIVRLTSDYDIEGIAVPHVVLGRPWVLRERYEPKPVDVDRLMLSSLGAWAELRGSWDLRNAIREREQLSVEEWQHVATLGRDHFARVVYAGFIWPTCHRASLIKTTERKVQSIDGAPVAVLRQRFNVLIRQPERGYAPGAYQYAGRENPFLASIRIHNVLTPDLALPAKISGTGAFWINDSNTPFRFACTGIDVNGGAVDFQMGAIFVPIDDLPARIALVQSAYESSNADWRTSRVGGRKVAFARPSAAELHGNTTLDTESFVLLAKPALGNDDTTRFVPYLGEATVRLPAVEQLVGNLGEIRIGLGDAYLANAANAAALFAKVLSLPKLEVPAERAGALATPNLMISGLSDRLGPLGGKAADLESGSFDPLSFFDGSAKLLGGIELGHIVRSVFHDSQFPAMRTQIVNETGIDFAVTTLTFEPEVHAFGPFELRGNGVSELLIETKIKRRIDAQAQAEQSASGRLTNFRMNLAGVISVDFDELKFSRVGDQPMSVTAVMPDDAIRFDGPLAFVNELRKHIPTSMFGGGLSIDVQPHGVRAGYTLALPPIEVGVLAIKNASLSASLFLPFMQDQARLRFAFCERHRPFQLVVTLFGGGGFLGIGVGMDGIEMVEASLEFGGAFSLNLGVASGSVEAMAGIYFKWEKRTGGEVVLITGYLRMAGSIEVLGIITVSLTFYLALAYQDDGKVRGQAALTVKVEVLMLSTSVTLSVEHSFSGSAGDPTFGQLVEESDWLTYANAFD